MKFILIGLVTLAVFIVVAEIVWHGILLPSLRLKHVRVETALPLSKELILSQADLKDTTPFYAINTEYVRNRLELLPMVAEAVVHKQFPDVLKIRLLGREALGVVLTTQQQSSVAAVFDREGVIFRVNVANAETLPVLSGIKLTERLRPGSKLQDELVPMLGQLSELKREAPALYAAISELRLVQRENGRMEILMYPVPYQIPVRLPSYLDIQTCNYAFLVLDALQMNAYTAETQELDFRTGNVILRKNTGGYAVQY